MPVGVAPKVTGLVSHLTDDGEDIKVEYQVLGRRQRRKRIITEDELDRGTWASKLGMSRPGGADARLAFATVIRMLALSAPEVPARAYYSEAGDLILPNPDAQQYGYLTTEGTEADAREAWKEIGEWAREDPKTCLVLGILFVGPILSSLGVYAHIVNLIGAGQQGKSTALEVSTAALGTIKPKRQQLLMGWNSSKQGITQTLRARGFLPAALDEHSSAGRTVKDASKEFSAIVAGCIRLMGTADGSARENDGFWHSTILSSSNQPLKFRGQSEDLASRLHEIEAPFWPHEWVTPGGTWADPNSGAAEHVSKRLRRLATSAGGWPLLWADQQGMFKAANLAKLKAYHLDLCARHAPHTGGIPDTIAEHHMAWVVGAYMLGEVIGIDLAEKAEQAAAERLRGAIEVAAAANEPDGVRLWNALDSLRIEAFAYPPRNEVVKAAQDGFQRVKGFTDPDIGLWWVIPEVVRDAAAGDGIENLEAALHQLLALGVLVREKSSEKSGRLTYQLPRPLRDHVTARMYCFNTFRATELWASEDTQDGSGDGVEPAGTSSGTSALVPDSGPLTSSGTSGTSGTSKTAPSIHTREGTTARPALVLGEQTSLEELETDPAAAAVADVDEQGHTAPRRHDATTPQESADVARLYPTPAERITDPAWSTLRRDAAAIGVLSADGLHLPNREVVPMGLPASVDEVVPLMTAYGLRTLYLHQDSVEALGLPSFQDRLDAKVKPGWGEPHEWATPAPDSPITAIYPAGLSEWMGLVVAADDPKKPLRLNVAIPAYEGRFDKASEPARGGFGGAADGAALLDAVMVWTLSTLHNDRQRRPQVFPYYRSPNKTAEELAGGKGPQRRAEVLCLAIRNKEVPPATYGRLVPTMAPRKWHRDPTRDERGCGWLHQYDKTAAWMGAYSNLGLGVGEPEHAADGMAYDPKFAGYWRVPEVPGHGLEGLPALEFGEAPEGGHWLRTPAVDLLREIYPQWTPEVAEAWYWPDTRRALNGFYRHLKESRDFILDAMAQGRPGGKWAKQVNGRLYQSFWGHLQRVAGPKQDTETGGNYDYDIYWRPDWSGAFLDLACANVYRDLMKFAKSKCFPMTLDVDAITIASDQADPELAKPAAMVLGDRLGNWTVEGSAPLSALLPVIDGGKDAHHALALYLKSQEA